MSLLSQTCPDLPHRASVIPARPQPSLPTGPPIQVSGKFTYFKTLLANPEESLVNPLRLPRPAPRAPTDASDAPVWIDTPFDHLSLDDDDPPAPVS